MSSDARMPDDNPRPSKRQRVLSSDNLKALPPPILLLSLQSLLAHPPNHRNHNRSLFVTLFALRKCLAMPGLEMDPVMECRVWIELAEVGFRIGLDEPGVESEVEKAITKALLIVNKHPSLRTYKPQISRLSAKLAYHQNNPKFAQNTLKKVLTNFIISSDPPQLLYSSHLSYISSLSNSPEVQEGAANASFKALGAIRDLRELAMRNNHLDIAALARVLELKELMQHGLWTEVAEVLSATEQQLGISAVLDATTNSSVTPAGESGIAESSSVPTPSTTTTLLSKTPIQKVLITHALLIGTLFFTYSGSSSSSQPRLRTLHEMLDGGALDAFGSSGLVKVDFPEEPFTSAIEVQVAHPRVVYTLAYLVSSVAKRDPVGRKPKRRLFALEGKTVVEKELRKEVAFPMWASVEDVKEFQGRMQKMKADMMCELIGVAISRSEFDDAERELSKLIAHTRTYALFSAYSARITLHQAHLAHALGQSERALRCYEVAAFLSRKPSSATSSAPSSSPSSSSTSSRLKSGGSPNKTPTKASSYARPSVKDELCSNSNPQALEDTLDVDSGDASDYWLNVSARAGSLWLRVGLASAIEDEDEREAQLEVLRKEMKLGAGDGAGAGLGGLAKECEGLGGTIGAVGAVLEACLSKEFLIAKTRLRTALNLSTTSQDNHLRALVLALIAAQYVHTSTEHAETMLGTAEQLAAGLGAQAKVQGKDDASSKGDAREVKGAKKTEAAPDAVGNAHLRLWIGERSLELKRRAGDEKAAAKQVAINEKMEKAVERVRKRKLMC